MMSDQPGSADRIDRDERGELDDVVIENVAMFRMERMDGKHIWIALYREGKPDIVFRVTARNRITWQQDL